MKNRNVISRADLITERKKTQRNMDKLTAALHDADFSSLLIESQQVSNDQRFMLRVFIDESEIAGLRMLKLMEIAANFDATMTLAEIWLGGQSRVSRMCLWPKHD